MLILVTVLLKFNRVVCKSLLSSPALSHSHKSLDGQYPPSPSRYLLPPASAERRAEALADGVRHLLLHLAGHRLGGGLRGGLLQLVAHRTHRVLDSAHGLLRSGLRAGALAACGRTRGSEMGLLGLSGRGGGDREGGRQSRRERVREGYRREGRKEGRKEGGKGREGKDGRTAGDAIEREGER